MPAGPFRSPAAGRIPLRAAAAGGLSSSETAASAGSPDRADTQTVTAFMDAARSGYAAVLPAM